MSDAPDNVARVIAALSLATSVVSYATARRDTRRKGTRTKTELTAYADGVLLAVGDRAPAVELRFNSRSNLWVKVKPQATAERNLAKLG